MNTKKFVTNLLFLLVLNMLVKPFWILGIDRAFQNAVGAEEYGIYFALFNFSFLFNIFLDLGITNFNNKNIAQNNHLLSKHFPSIIGLKLVLSGVYILMTLGLAFILGYNTDQAKFLFVLALNQFFISIILYLRSNLAGLHLFKTDSVISVLDRLIMIVICSLLLWGHFTTEKPKILWYAYAQLIAYIITALIAFVLVIDRARIRKIKWNIPFYIMILKQSLPFAFLILLMTFYNRIDTVMLERLLPDGAFQSGVYAQAYRLLDAANMIAYLFSVPLLPMFAKMLKNNESTEELTSLSYRMIIVPAIIVASGCFFYSKELMGLLYINHVNESAEVFSYLMMCFVAISTTYIFGTLLTANGNLKQLNTMASIGMLFNIGVNLILIPIYKAQGAVWVSLFTQFFTAIAQIIMASKVLKFKTNYTLIVKIVCFFVLAFIINYLSKQVFYSPDKWIINFILAALLIGFMALSFNIISLKSGLTFLQGSKKDKKTK
jgi:O-antigen/teichoic acid export membrane protein